MPRFHPRSPVALLSYVGVSFLIFELMHRVFGLPQWISSTVLGVLVLPLLLLGLMGTLTAILADPDDLRDSMRHVVGFLILTIVFFAFLYMELGIVSALSPRVEIHDFWVCLYFSVATLTTLGYGDFIPSPEARFIAVIEAVIGYLVLGIITSAVFFLISHQSQKRGAKKR